MPTVILLEGLLVTGVSGIGLYASVKEEHNLLRYVCDCISIYSYFSCE